MKGKEQGASHARGERAALYLRVSTDEQTVENQRPELEQLARARGLHVVATYTEIVSGAARKRPRFDAMMADAHRGRFEFLLVWDLTRFGRSMIGNMTAVLELDRRGIQVISVRDTWLDQPAGPLRDLLVAIFSWVAQQEREQLVARTKVGLEGARRRGIRLGRPPARVDVGRARILVEREGLSLRRAAKMMGLSSSVLHRALRGVS